MFRVYKPKNFVKVRALQVTKENAQDVAALLLGRVALSDTHAPDGTRDVLGVDVPTFEQPMHFEVGSWVLRADDNTLSKMSAEEFDKTYEVARNTSGDRGFQIGNGNVQSNHF